MKLITIIPLHFNTSRFSSQTLMCASAGRPSGCSTSESGRRTSMSRLLRRGRRPSRSAVAGFGAAVAADVEVVASLRRRSGRRLCDWASAHSRMQPETAILILCGRADALVPVLDLDREADRVLHAVAAPGRSDAALHGPERLAVGVPAFECPPLDELVPQMSGRSCTWLPEQIDPLPAGDLACRGCIPWRPRRGRSACRA